MNKLLVFLHNLIVGGCTKSNSDLKVAESNGKSCFKVNSDPMIYRIKISKSDKHILFDIGKNQMISVYFPTLN